MEQNTNKSGYIIFFYKEKETPFLRTTADNYLCSYVLELAPDDRIQVFQADRPTVGFVFPEKKNAEQFVKNVGIRPLGFGAIGLDNPDCYFNI